MFVFADTNTSDTNTKRNLKVSILLCALGVFGQGIITMDTDALDMVLSMDRSSSSSKDSSKDTESVQFTPNWQSTIHQLLAAVFFMAAMFHGMTCVRLLFAQQYATSNSYRDVTLSTWFKALMLVLPILFQLLCFWFHPVMTGNKSHDSLNLGGITQWLVVGSYLLFFASYAYDYHLIHTSKYVYAHLNSGEHSPKKY